MERETPRIERVAVGGPTALTVHWRGKRAADRVELAGWIATGGELLAPLLDPDEFAKAHVENFGTAVAWDHDGERIIDAMHLKLLAAEQKPFSNSDVRAWQTSVKLSNREAADLLGVSLSTWNTYKVNARIPSSIAMICRAVLRDPLMMQAHLRPTRPAGRPRKEA